MTVFSRSPAKTGLRRQKSARSGAHSARIGSLRHSAVASDPDQRLKAFHIENHVFAVAEVFENLNILTFRVEL
jgi:hypothetical protein